MRRTPSSVLGRGLAPTEDDLRLPRPPGVIRRFWERHPLTTDIVIAVLALLLSFPAVAASSSVTDGLSGWGAAVAIGLSAIACVGLVWRRRRPVLVFVVSMLPTLVVEVGFAAAVSGPASLIALYSIAVYRGVRACWIALGVACGVLALNGLGYSLFDPADASVYINLAVTTIVGLLVAALVGVNVGNRRRYLEALIDRSRQLVVERDQQAQLAAAAERTRIAREMHDIVSHSLTVVVALAEGAVATPDTERAREASRAVAATARDALTEMRVMLGVLRTDTADADAPLGPLLDASLHDIVAAARGAGAPVTLTVTGQPTVPTAHRLAVLRIVQEGITNAMRHAPDASYVRVTTEYSDEGIRITVENDGAREVDAATVAGWGLTGLRERVANIGGTLTAGPSGPSTWRLTAEIPPEGPHA
ncbi:sensor histidine kinase [Microbacterium flavescens]|uniref:sensor histidine kinase n=1 Tax=Microbacterium flavescens TaxID=69366 RepID=UPI0027DE0501|nr:histidine kinase [Microbacterium flavescens]